MLVSDLPRCPTGETELSFAVSRNRHGKISWEANVDAEKNSEIYLLEFAAVAKAREGHLAAITPMFHKQQTQRIVLE